MSGKIEFPKSGVPTGFKVSPPICDAIGGKTMSGKIQFPKSSGLRGFKVSPPLRDAVGRSRSPPKKPAIADSSSAEVTEPSEQHPTPMPPKYPPPVRLMQMIGEHIDEANVGDDKEMVEEADGEYAEANVGDDKEMGEEMGHDDGGKECEKDGDTAATEHAHCQQMKYMNAMIEDLEDQRKDIKALFIKVMLSENRFRVFRRRLICQYESRGPSSESSPAQPEEHKINEL